MTVAEAIKKPTARVAILAEITCGVWCRAWVVDGSLTNTYKVILAEEVVDVKWNGSTTLTQRASAALVDASAGSWYWDGAVLWVRPPSGSIFENVVQAFVKFWFCRPQAKILDNRFYDPRLLSAPAISQRIEPVFGGIGQIGGGTITLANADGFFDGMQDYQWNAGTVTLKIGVDTAAGEMAFSDYETLATWSISAHSRNHQDFTLTLVEPKAKTKAKLPNTFFSRDDYPNIEDDEVGKPIPIRYGRLYGLEPVLIDPGGKEFQIAGHAIREFSAVRLERSIEEFHSRTITAWYLHSSDTYRYYLAGEEATAVKFNSTVLTKRDTLDDVVANDSSWIQEENFVYVNPPAGQTITSGTWTIESSKTFSGWQESNFASVDTSTGRFTMGEDWSLGQGISVDIIGKTDGGVLIENSIDIIEDILTTAGETSIDSASFAAARALLKLGTDESGGEVFVRSVAVDLKEPEEIMEIIGEILSMIGGYLYSDATGEFHIGVFMPQPGDALPRFTDTDIIEFEELTESDSTISKVKAEYAPREQDDFLQVEERERIANQYINGQPAPVVSENEVFLPNERDVEYWADRKLIMEGEGIKRFEIVTAWQGITLKPGAQVLLQSTSRGVDQVLEILETRLDLGSMRVTLGLGNLRNLRDTPGFWVADGSSVLPTDFAAETGYAAGALTWNASWSDAIRNWVKQNVGYWTDANGFATTADGKSFNTSNWV